MSRALHRLFLDRLLPRNWSDAEPPVLLNSWEAKYFHVNHHNIVDMAVQVRYISMYVTIYPQTGAHCPMLFLVNSIRATCINAVSF